MGSKSYRTKVARAVEDICEREHGFRPPHMRVMNLLREPHSLSDGEGKLPVEVRAAQLVELRLERLKGPSVSVAAREKGGG